MATKTKVKEKKRTTTQERADCYEACELRRKAVEQMSPAEREKRIAELRSELAKSAPYREAIDCHLFDLILLAGAAFRDRYYPDAYAALSLSNYVDGDCHYHVSIQIPNTAAKAAE